MNQALVFGVHPIIVTLHDYTADPLIDSIRASDLWQLDFAEIETAIKDSPVPVKGFILNSPHNPTGKVFKDEVRRCYESE